MKKKVTELKADLAWIQNSVYNLKGYLDNIKENHHEVLQEKIDLPLFVLKTIINDIHDFKDNFLELKREIDND